MLIGPIFTREAVTAPRRPRFFLYRTLYAAALLLLTCTAWAVLTGTQQVRNLGDMSLFGSLLLQILALVQLALLTFFAALGAAGSVAQEKDKKTLLLLLMTRLSDREVVLGKLFAGLLPALVMLLAGLPVFGFAMLLGGITFAQVGWVFLATLATLLAAGSLGCTLALWREKTFQTLALTALVIVSWVGFWEAVFAGVLGRELFGFACEALAETASPLRAVLAAARPTFTPGQTISTWTVPGYVSGACGGSVLFGLVGMLRLRVWNPTREVRAGVGEEEQAGRVPTAAEGEAVETIRSGHVDARLRGHSSTPSRVVWDNPILWREACTWAYGRKILVIRLAYLLLFAFCAFGLHSAVEYESARGRIDEAGTRLPAAAGPLIPFCLVSLVLVNALAVTSITGERDGRTLDLLLVTDLSPREFHFGKLAGVFLVTREMVLLPLALCLYLWLRGGITLENLLYLTGGLAVMNLFVAVLGVHSGRIHANSRTAIMVSLGTVFFLFLGVATCIQMMISFRGSFQFQLAPFLAFILGGGVGLYVAIGDRNPSSAMGLAAIVVPFATFYALTSFFLEAYLPMFLVTAAAYGFTCAAMLIPALSEFDFAQGRGRAEAED